MKRILLLASVSLPSAVFAQSFHLIGDLPGSSVHSAATKVSNSGLVVGHSMGTPNSHAVRWTNGAGLLSLGYFGGDFQSSAANGLSGDGQVIVGTSTKAGSPPLNKAMVWRNGSFTTLSDVPGGNITARAEATNADGSVVVGVSEGSVIHAVRWTLTNGVESGRQLLPDLPGGRNQAHALDVSDDGNTIVGFGWVAAGSLGNTNATRWRNGQVISLGISTESSQATAVSADGETIVGEALASLNDRQAFIWREDTGMVKLGDLEGGSIGSSATGVTADGRTVVGNGLIANNETAAFIWKEEIGMLRLDTYLTSMGVDMSALGPQGFLRVVTDISDDGRYLVGQGQVGVNSIGWVVDLGPQQPVPEPATMAALGIGAIGLLRRRRRK